MLVYSGLLCFGWFLLSPFTLPQCAWIPMLCTRGRARSSFSVPKLFRSAFPGSSPHSQPRQGEARSGPGLQRRRGPGSQAQPAGVDPSSSEDRLFGTCLTRGLDDYVYPLSQASPS